MKFLHNQFCKMSHVTQKIQYALSKEKIHLIDEVFVMVDERNKGFLDQDDLKVAIMALFGYKPSKSEVTQMIASYGGPLKSETSGLTLTQMKEALVPKFMAVDEDEEIRNTFTAFDRNCRGFLNFEDVKKVFSEICPHVPENTVRMAFKEMDRDGDGRVSYKDFDFMMKFNNYS